MNVYEEGNMIHVTEIDPMALLLRGDIYVKIHLPRPVETGIAKEIIKGMSAAERKEALARVKALNSYCSQLEKELSI
jgi:hypothetical protein